ncbi:hypothetical protein D3C75_1194270 [compost metagenome]
MMSTCQTPARIRPATTGLRLYTPIAPSASILLIKVATGPTTRKTTGEAITRVNSGTTNILMDDGINLLNHFSMVAAKKAPIIIGITDEV